MGESGKGTKEKKGEWVNGKREKAGKKTEKIDFHTNSDSKFCNL